MKTVKANSDFRIDEGCELREGDEYEIIQTYKSEYTRSGYGYVVLVSEMPIALDASFFDEFINIH